MSVSALKQNLDDSLISSLLYIHSLTGCDTTSRPHGIGKVSALAKHANLKEFAKMIMLQNKTSREIEQAGEQALGVLYGCITGSTLDFERAARFSKKVVFRSSYIPPERLPPTCDASRFHSMRVYLQVQIWLGHELDPTKWDWDIQKKNSRGDIMKPHKMDNSAAPDNLLKIIKCNCAGKCDKIPVPAGNTPSYVH